MVDNPGSAGPGGDGRTPTLTDVRERLASMRRLIGHTPLLSIACLFRGKRFTIHAKHEVMNLTGSIKDRMALHILDRAYAVGAIRPGGVIAEATSGNTGISFAAIGRALGNRVRIYIPDWMSQERVLVIQSFGAEIVPVSRDAGGFLGSIEQADEHARRNPDVFLPHQFESTANVDAHHRTTGPELLEQLARLGLQPDAFVAGVGTGGTVMGVGRLLRERVESVRVHPLEPANSPTLRTGSKVGKHRIQGISDEFIPPIVHLDQLDAIVDAWDGDAILMAQKIARQLGLAVGISSGANLLGALQIAAELDPGAVVATVFPDSNKKYLSTDLCRDEPVLPEYLTPEVDLLSYRVVSRP